jgi:hypothetical protein
MRLLSAKTLQLAAFPDDRLPAYAILSHTWGDDELLPQDLGANTEEKKSKKGYAKVRGCCERALGDGLEWVWIDTCCIDKSSSAELSEAINSMFRWYQRADVCYAYLADVSIRDLDDDAIIGSRWFTRGWTLQELLAPGTVTFYTSEWRLLGSKTDLSKPISSTTGIDEQHLHGKRPQIASVAERMSWAARRQTTRVEDMAYCLLGIFDINMPLIYGEGEKAFSRLQEEILKSLDEQSVFAWTLNSAYNGDRLDPYRPDSINLIAATPIAFRLTGDILPCNVGPLDAGFTTSNRGILLKTPLCRLADGRYYAPLKCRLKNDCLHVLALPLNSRQATVTDAENEEFYRYNALLKLLPREIWQTESVMSILIRRQQDFHGAGESQPQDGYQFRRLPRNFEVAQV